MMQFQQYGAGERWRCHCHQPVWTRQSPAILQGSPAKVVRHKPGATYSSYSPCQVLLSAHKRHHQRARDSQSPLAPGFPHHDPAPGFFSLLRGENSPRDQRFCFLFVPASTREMKEPSSPRHVCHPHRGQDPHAWLRRL